MEAVQFSEKSFNSYVNDSSIFDNVALYKLWTFDWKNIMKIFLKKQKKNLNDYIG